LRIGFVSIHDASDVRSWSGIPFQILQQMRAQGADVHTLTPLHTNAKYLVAPAKLLGKVAGKSVTLDHFGVVLRAYARQISAFVSDRSIDVIFSPSTIPITLLDCGKPIVTWTDAVFSAMNDYYGATFGNMTAAAVARGHWQEEAALRNCRMAVFASTWALEGARKVTDIDKLRVLPFGASLPVTHSADDVARAALEKRKSRPRKCQLLFVGADWERKGGDTAIETAQNLNDAGIETTLWVVGSQPQSEVPRFVELLGFIDKTSDSEARKLVELFQSADFLILPTRAEAAGIVFSEASAFGLPSVTYATGGVTDYVRTGVNGICIEPGGSAARFADAIRKMMADTTEYAGYCTRGFNEYKERLNWECSVRKLIEICSECVAA
jgi:glycosyltransferase involved in cell wall biosynthesis